MSRRRLCTGGWASNEDTCLLLFGDQMRVNLTHHVAAFICAKVPAIDCLLAAVILIWGLRAYRAKSGYLLASLHDRQRRVSHFQSRAEAILSAVILRLRPVSLCIVAV